MIHRFEIIIVGGGMAGLALACALGQQGRKVAILEARGEPPAFSPDDPLEQRVVALSRNSQNLLSNLGVWPQISAWRATPYSDMHIWDQGGAGAIHFSAADLQESDLGHIVENRLVQRALFEKMRTQENVTWFCPAEVSRVVSDEKDAVVTLADGQILTASLVVGADGAQSGVRKAVGIELKETDYDHLGIVGIVQTEFPHANCAYQRFMQDGVLAFLPMPEGRCSIVWSVKTDKAKSLLQLNDEAFCQALEEASEARLGKILHSQPRAGFPLRGRHVETYIKPRIALVADAAHTIHPLAGQGINLGFMDVAALAQAIENSPREPGSHSILRRYERSRSGENQIMLKMMEGFQKIFINDIAPIATLRNFGMTALDSAAPVKSLMMRYALGTMGERPRLVRSGAVIDEQKKAG